MDLSRNVYLREDSVDISRYIYVLKSRADPVGKFRAKGA